MAEIKLTPAEVLEAERIGVTPEQYAAAKSVEVARRGGREGPMDRLDYEAIAEIERRGRGVSIDQWRAATGRDATGRKPGDDSAVRLTGTVHGRTNGGQA